MKQSAPVLDAAPDRKPPEQENIRRVCFVCTGNTCRSPMAAALYNHLHAGEPTHAFSAGLCANEGEPIALNALLALKGRGVVSNAQNNYEVHKSQMLTKEMVDLSDAVYALTSRHYLALCTAFPEEIDKFHVLGEIADPYGGSLDLYRQTLAEIEEALHA